MKEESEMKNETREQQLIRREVIELLRQLSPQKMKKATDYLLKLKESNNAQSIQGNLNKEGDLK